MAHYPTVAEIAATMTDEQIAEKIAALPSYHTAPVDIVSLALPTVTPEIMVAWGSFISAIKAEYPTATASPTAISRPRTHDELMATALQDEISRVYNENLEAEKGL